MRFREQDKLNAVTERRRAIEAADKERKEALLRKAQEREAHIEEKRRAEAAQRHFAFGSSTPRTLHPGLGASSTDLWSQTSPSAMTQSMYSTPPSAVGGSRRSIDRDTSVDGKRSTSVTALDKSGQGKNRHFSNLYRVNGNGDGITAAHVYERERDSFIV